MTTTQKTQTSTAAILLNSALAGILAFGIGTGTAFADGNETSAGASVPAVSAVQVNADTEAEEKPSLLPGDFFYFIKSIYENIRLAITVNDVKEAKLLAELAGERLAEAKALMEEGKQEEAEALLQKSIDIQEKAVVKIEAEIKVPSDAPATGVGEAVQEELQQNEKALKVKADLQHNIIALSAALEKVENPKAQEALLKNLEKAFGHLEKKLAKLETKHEKTVQAAVEASTAATATPSAPAQATPTPSAAPSAQASSGATIVTEASVTVEGTLQALTGSKPAKAEKQEKSEKEAKEPKESKNTKQDHGKSEEQHGKSENRNNSGK